MWTLEKLSLLRVSQDAEAAVHTCTIYSVVLKILANLTGMHLYRSLFSTCNLQLHQKRNAGMYRFRWVLRNFLGALSLWKTSCELILKGKFYEKWRTNIIVMTKICREVHSSFGKQTLWGKRYIWEPLIESWHWT